MTDTDVAWLIGQLILLYTLGWTAGFMLYVFRRAADFL